MDVLAHTLWTNAGARFGNKIAEKKGKKFRLHIGWTAFWGVIPDFFAFTTSFVIILYKIIFTGQTFGNFRENSRIIEGFDLSSYLYQFSHSIIIWVLVFVLVWLISRRPRYEMLGWLLHILIDIPSHSIGFYSTPFLFPISEYHFPYGISWANKWYMIVNYSSLLIIWFKIVFFEKKYKVVL